MNDAYFTIHPFRLEIIQRQKYNRDATIQYRIMTIPRAERARSTKPNDKQNICLLRAQVYFSLNANRRERFFGIRKRRERQSISQYQNVHQQTSTLFLLQLFFFVSKLFSSKNTYFPRILKKIPKLLPFGTSPAYETVISAPFQQNKNYLFH